MAIFRQDGVCSHCGSGCGSTALGERDGEEYHLHFVCLDCGKESVFLFDLQWYNSVTIDEYGNGMRDPV